MNLGPALTRRRHKRGTFSSVVDLQATIHRDIAGHDADPKPFTSTKTADPLAARGRPGPALDPDVAHLACRIA